MESSTVAMFFFSYNCIIYYGLTHCSYRHHSATLQSNAQLVQLLILEGEALYNCNNPLGRLFLHQCFKFTVSTAGYIHTAFIHRADLLQPSMFVIDAFCIKQKFNIQKSLYEVLRNNIFSN